MRPALVMRSPSQREPAVVRNEIIPMHSSFENSRKLFKVRGTAHWLFSCFVVTRMGHSGKAWVDCGWPL
jgi:hypothetical protein